MGVNSVIFANTSASSRIGSMLTAERLQRLIDCQGTEELKKCLAEFGYEGETTDDMFAAALNGIYAYVRELSPVPAAGNAILKKNDYHNAKVMAKCKYARREITQDLLYPHGLIPAGTLKEDVLNDDYNLLPAPMRDALEEVDLRFSQGERNGRLIDCLLNRAMYADIFETLGKGCAELKEIFVLEADFANISSAMRIRKNGLPKAALDEEFIPGGQLPKGRVEALLEIAPENVASSYVLSEYKELIGLACGELTADALTEYERASDNLIIRKLRAYRNSASGYMMFYSYCLARVYELKNVRIIAGGVRAGDPKEKIKAKLRESYV